MQCKGDTFPLHFKIAWWYSEMPQRVGTLIRLGTVSWEWAPIRIELVIPMVCCWGRAYGECYCLHQERSSIFTLEHLSSGACIIDRATSQHSAMQRSVGAGYSPEIRASSFENNSMGIESVTSRRAVEYSGRFSATSSLQPGLMYAWSFAFVLHLNEMEKRSGWVSFARSLTFSFSGISRRF